MYVAHSLFLMLFSQCPCVCFKCPNGSCCVIVFFSLAEVAASSDGWPDFSDEGSLPGSLSFRNRVPHTSHESSIQTTCQLHTACGTQKMIERRSKVLSRLVSVGACKTLVRSH